MKIQNKFRAENQKKNAKKNEFMVKVKVQCPTQSDTIRDNEKVRSKPVSVEREHYRKQQSPNENY